MPQGFEQYKYTHSSPHSAVLDVSGGDMEVDGVPRGFHANTNGTLVCKLLGDAADSTWVMVAGLEYALVIDVIRQSGTTVTGNVMF